MRWEARGDVAAPGRGGRGWRGQGFGVGGGAAVLGAGEVEERGEEEGGVLREYWARDPDAPGGDAGDLLQGAQLRYLQV